MNINELRNRITPIQLMYLLANAIPGETELRNFAQKIGIAFQGFRIKSVPESVVANSIVEEFYTNDIPAEAIVKLLEEKMPFELHINLRKLPKILKRHIEDLPDEQLAFILWYIIRYEYDKYNYLIKLIDKELEARIHFIALAKGAEQEEKIESLTKEKSIIETDYTKTKYELDKLKKEVEILRNSVLPLKQQLERKNELMNAQEKQIAELQQTIKTYQEKLEQYQQSEIKFAEEKDREITRLRNELEMLSAELKKRKFFDAKVVKRVGIFIDTENIYYMAKNLYGKLVNYESVVNKILDDPKRIMAHGIAYLIKLPHTEREKFINTLKSLGFETKEREPIIHADGSRKCNWDIGIAIDILKLINRLDVVVLVSGDGDFTELVEYIKSNYESVSVEVAAFESREHTSIRLVKKADRFIELTKEDLFK